MEGMGVDHLPEDQVGPMAKSIDAEVGELMVRPVDGLRTPCVWPGATYARCRRDGHVAGTAVVTAIGLDEDGHRVVLGRGVVDTESHGSWLGFLRRVRSRGVRGVQLVISDAHQGLRRAIQEVFQGAAGQRCAVHLVRAREWDARRHMSGGRMGDLCDRPIPRSVPDATIGDRARRALEASLELAEGLRAAWDGHQTSDAGKGAYTNNPDTTTTKRRPAF